MGSVDGSRDHITNVCRPRVAIALGGGGARGIAHVLALEALDDMGIRPVAIAGTSMGAVVGAAYAAGIEGRPFRPTYCEFCATAPTSWASFCGRESGASLTSCSGAVATLCCWT
ncbi:MAG: patatin-like phospholipase family protein, partial [Roseiarcus sp.]|uniref:patatin-like phospholipase family protein n=1 Tax=Roseiarcus sp. TaxID=1969460 RepID=UPI003BAE7AA0